MNFGFWAMVMCQCGVITGNKCASLTQEADGEGGSVRQTDCGCKNSVLFIKFCWGVLEIHNSQHGIPRTFELKRNERLQNCFRVEDSCFSPQVQTASIWSFLCKSFIFCMALVLIHVSKNSSHLSICKFELPLADSI